MAKLMSSPAILYMLGIISSRPCDAVNVVHSAPACSAPWIAPAAPPSDCISITRGTPPQRVGVRRGGHSSESAPSVDDGVIGEIGITSLARYATDGAASCPS